MIRTRPFALVLASSLVLLPSAFADDPVPTITPFAFMIQSGTYTNKSPTTVNNTGGYSAIVGYTAQDPDTLGFTGPASPDITMSNNSGWGGDMWVYNASNVTLTGGDNTVTPAISGGTISRYLIALNTSTINLSDQGFAKVIELHDGSQLIMNGGTIGVPNNQSGYSYLGLWDTATAHLSAGSIYGGVSASGSTTIIVSGTGIVGDLISDGVGSSVSMTSGFVSGGVGIDDGAVGAFQGGTYNGLAVGGENASLTMDAGTCTSILYNGGAATMTMNGGTATGISVGGTGGVTTLSGGTINGDVGAGNGGTLYLNSGAVNGNISVGGGGTVVLNGIAVTGNASLAGGTLTLNSGSIGGNLTVNGGTLNWGSSVSIGGSLILQGNSQLTIDRSVSGSIQLSNNARFELDGGTVSGTLTAGNLSSFTITGGSTGAVTLNDDSNLYLSGGQVGTITTSTENTIQITGPATVSGDINLHSSITDEHSEALIEAGTITGKVTVFDGSIAYFFAGTVHGIEGDGYGSINWIGGTLAGSAPIYLNNASTLSLTGINVVSSLLNANSGGYSVYSVSGYFGDGTPFPSVQVFVQNPTASYPSGATFNFNAAQQQWSTNAGGNWASPANWAPNLVPNGIGAYVSISDTTYIANPTDAHITLNGNYTLGYLSFETANNVIIDPGTGGTLTFDNAGNGASISVSGGQHQINVPVIAHDNLSISVYGSEDDGIRLALSPSFHPNDEFAYPTLTLANGITIASGKTLSAYGFGEIFSPFIRGGGVDIEGGNIQILPNGTPTGTSRISSLNIPYGTLDLMNNNLILDYTPGNSPLDLIQTYIADGYDGGYWNGGGIISSAAAGNADLSTTLGYADNSTLGLTSFDGQGVGANVILIKYTWFGDANLDGIVNNADLMAISPIGTTWQTGDFNYDGVVNADDYTLFMLGDAESGGENISTMLPEPATLLPLISFCLLLLRSRRQ